MIIAQSKQSLNLSKSVNFVEIQGTTLIEQPAAVRLSLRYRGQASLCIY